MAKYITLENLSVYDEKIKGKMAVEDTATLTSAKEYADGLNTAMDTRVKTVEGDVAVLKGDDQTVGSVAYQIAQIVAGADASFDTLKEIADWIVNDTTGAAKMASDIADNKEAITNLETLVGTIPEDATAEDIVGYIQEYVTKALTDSDLSQYAKADDLDALEEVVGTATVDNGDGTSTPATGMMARMEAVEDGVQTNADAIAEVKADIEAMHDIHIDETAENKFNVESGKVELFLNDGSENVIARDIIAEAMSKPDGFHIRLEDGRTAEDVATFDVEDTGTFDENNEKIYKYEKTIKEINEELTNFYGSPTKLYADTGNGNMDEDTEVTDIEYIFLQIESGNKYYNAHIVSSTQTKVEVDMSGLTSKVDANTTAIAQAKTDLKAYADQAEADAIATAKSYTDEKVAGLVDSAPEALDTLNELATAINDNKEIYDAYIDTHAQAMATMKSELQAEIDAVETDLANAPEIHVDAEADNKFNAETGKVELFLNDSETTVEYKKISVEELGGLISFSEGMAYSMNFERTQAEDSSFVISNLITMYPESTEFCVLDGDNYVAYDETNAQDVVDGTKTLYAAVPSQSPSTKIEVDMSGLTSKVDANAQAIEVLNGDDSVEGSVAKAVKDGVTEAKAYADELNTAMDERVDQLDDVVFTNERNILSLSEALERSDRRIDDIKETLDAIEEVTESDIEGLFN